LKESLENAEHPIIGLSVEGKAKVTKGDPTPLTIYDCKLISLKTLPKPTP
jgi:hypothetical protein